MVTDYGFLNHIGFNMNIMLIRSETCVTVRVVREVSGTWWPLKRRKSGIPPFLSSLREQPPCFLECIKMRRNRLDICADILRVALGGARKTQIVYQANLNFGIVKGYLDFLLTNRLLSEETPFFRSTERGVEYLESYEQLRSSIQPF